MKQQFLKSVFFVFCFVLSSSFAFGQSTSEEEQKEMTLRMIGDQFLLRAKDTITEVLPITAEESEYTISFSDSVVIEPVELVNLTNEILKSSKICNGYLLRIEECESGNVIFSYRISNLENAKTSKEDGKEAPKGCYNLLFTFDSEGESAIESEPRGFNLWFFLMPVAVLLTVFLVLRKPKKQ